MAFVCEAILKISSCLNALFFPGHCTHRLSITWLLRMMSTTAPGTISLSSWPVVYGRQPRQPFKDIPFALQGSLPIGCARGGQARGKKDEEYRFFHNRVTVTTRLTSCRHPHADVLVGDVRLYPWPECDQARDFPGWLPPLHGRAFGKIFSNVGVGSTGRARAYQLYRKPNLPVSRPLPIHGQVFCQLDNSRAWSFHKRPLLRPLTLPRWHAHHAPASRTLQQGDGTDGAPFWRRANKLVSNIFRYSLSVYSVSFF